MFSANSPSRIPNVGAQESPRGRSPQPLQTPEKLKNYKTLQSGTEKSPSPARYDPRDKSPENNFGVPDISTMSLSEARSYYRSQLNKTSYQRQFGEPLKAESEFLLLKSKKFSTCEISLFFKREVKSTVERWLTHNQPDHLISCLYFTARDLFTFIKQAQTSDTTYTHFFWPKRAEKAPRFDQILLKSKQMNSPSTKYNTDSKMGSLTNHQNSLESILKVNPNEGLFGGQSSKNGKAMMRGQPYNIIEFVENKEPKRSDYQETFKGLQNASRTKKAEVQRDSIVNHVSPDPTSQKTIDKRRTTHVQDMKNMTMRTFSYTGGSGLGWPPRSTQLDQTIEY
jgi:hypothetical protein